jgi:ribosomal protein S12 methylthiotransferase
MISRVTGRRMTTNERGKRARGPAPASGPRVHLASLGCAKNLVDSERLLAKLAAAGALVGATAEEADVIVVNTCGFIRPAKEESIGAIVEYSRLKEEGSCRKLVVMGCLAERYAKELREGFPEVDAVFGIHQQEAVVAACGLVLPDTDDPGRLLVTPRHTAYLRVSEGCDNRCSYCAIPAIRGGFRSRPAEEVLDEARRLVAGGVRELVVIGQDTTLYGTDLAGEIRIHELLARLAEIRHLRWIRLLYTHPAHFTEDLVDAYLSLSKLCPYVDIPLQHLSDRILRRMRRRVTQAQCLALIERLRSAVPGIAIRTTFLVGFPGETRAEFNELLRLGKDLRFDHLGAFAYSREEGTPAARLPGQVSERAKSRRLRDLMLAQQEIAFARNRAMRGGVLEVVVDRPSAERGVWIARSRTQAPDVDGATYLRGEGLRPGLFVQAKITASRGYDLVARSCEPPHRRRRGTFHA